MDQAARPRQPLVGVPADTFTRKGFTYHQSDGKYLRAVLEVAGVCPVIVPALEALNVADVISRLDGVLITGAVSNVHPSRYGAEPTPRAEPYDEARDRGSFGLIGAALKNGLPVLAICRGVQELNAALGGTLHAEVHEIEGRLDHRDPGDEDMDVRYGPHHEVTLTPGGLLARITSKSALCVNSLHRQAIADLAPGLAVEAVAGDGTIEAVRVENAAAFALGVQWHPEYDAATNPDSGAIFDAFGRAVHEASLAHEAS